MSDQAKVSYRLPVAQFALMGMAWLGITIWGLFFEQMTISERITLVVFSAFWASGFFTWASAFYVQIRTNRYEGYLKFADVHREITNEGRDFSHYALVSFVNGYNRKFWWGLLAVFIVMFATEFAGHWLAAGQ